jgi:hypothetical protein
VTLRRIRRTGMKARAEINSWDDNLKCIFLGVKGTTYKVYQDLETAV